MDARVGLCACTSDSAVFTVPCKYVWMEDFIGLMGNIMDALIGSSVM